MTAANALSPEWPEPARHLPVMAAEVVAALAPRPHGWYVDGTFGAGGYSRALLAAAPCRVSAIDRDPDAVALGRAQEAASDGRLQVIEGCFGNLDALLGPAAAGSVDGITFDLGVSSPQLDRPERGFSFRFDGPLDMRMGQHGISAAEVVNQADEDELGRLIYTLGEERQARRVARAIVKARTEAPIERTGQLAEIVRRVVGRARDGIDPATRTFQALRLHVNDELGQLEQGLAAAERLLRPGGRLAVVAFHSLEDRIVKEFLRQRSGGEGGGGSRHAPPSLGRAPEPSFRLISRRAILPGEPEQKINPRARSARLRVAERTDAPPFSHRPSGPEVQ